MKTTQAATRATAIAVVAAVVAASQTTVATAFAVRSSSTTRSTAKATLPRAPSTSDVLAAQAATVAAEGTRDDKEALPPPPPELLGLPARPGRPLKVAIAGGGVGGLTAALCMLQRGFDVTVYEKTAAFARFGGPIQFASNALSVLKQIDDDGRGRGNGGGLDGGVFDRIMEKFTFTGTRACGIKDGLRADGTFRMTDDSLSYLWDAGAPADWFVKFPLKGCADLYGLPYTGVVDRPDLQEILIDECRKISPDFIRNGNAVVSYECRGPGNGVSVALQDGTTEDADLLVGSDGIWSAVRAHMYGEELRASSSDLKRRQGCTYSGYTVFAGETVIKTPDYYETGYKVYIGPKRYFVTSDVGDGRIQWYAFFALPPGTKRAPSGWGGSTREQQANPEENLVEYIKSLHDGWTDEIMTILDATPPESVEQRDLYDRSPEFFRSWAKGNVVLMGDAVHPMMPNLGQGGCQAIEDAYVLTDLLSKTRSTDKIQDTLQEFYRSRILRVSAVQFLSRLASDLIINAFDTPWSPHDSLGKSWKSYLTFFWKPFLQYVIFPAQFAFLYSYHPTGNMGELPSALESRWRIQHERDSELAFDKVAREGQRSSGPSFFQRGSGSGGVGGGDDATTTTTTISDKSASVEKQEEEEEAAAVVV